MAISLVGQGGISGGFQGSPQVINYSSSSGNSLILSGFLYNSSVEAPGITGITDSAGNTWNYATSTSQNPPYASDDAGGNSNITFVAWCINAAPITSLTFTMPANNPWTRVLISEWSGIASYDSSASASSTAGTSPTATLNLSSVDDLVIGACEPNSGSINVSAPSGWTAFTASGSVNNNAYGFPGVNGSYSPSYTLSGSGDWSLALAAFRPVVESSLLIAAFP